MTNHFDNSSNHRLWYWNRSGLSKPRRKSSQTLWALIHPWEMFSRFNKRPMLRFPGAVTETQFTRHKVALGAELLNRRAPESFASFPRNPVHFQSRRRCNLLCHNSWHQINIPIQKQVSLFLLHDLHAINGETAELCKNFFPSPTHSLKATVKQT